MRKVKEMDSGGYYLFESLSSGKSCYFESEEEIRLFRNLLDRYMKKYIRIDKLYISSEGYHILLKIRGKEVLRKRYIERCISRKKMIRMKFIEEIWRIISNQLRIFHSVYVKAVNKLRGRKGVLVQKRYERFIFDSVEEYKEYVLRMDGGQEIEAQKEKKYRVSKRRKKKVSWGFYRWIFRVEGFMNRAFHGFVVDKLIIKTKSYHSPPP